MFILLFPFGNDKYTVKIKNKVRDQIPGVLPYFKVKMQPGHLIFSFY